MWKWKIVRIDNGEVLEEGFASLHEADGWHDGWIGEDWDWDAPDVRFQRYLPLPVI